MKSKLLPNQIAKICELYSNDSSKSFIMNIYSIGEETLNKILNDNGIAIRKGRQGMRKSIAQAGNLLDYLNPKNGY